jgi:hypothetical protein
MACFDTLGQENLLEMQDMKEMKKYKNVVNYCYRKPDQPSLPSSSLLPSNPFIPTLLHSFFRTPILHKNMSFFKSISVTTILLLAAADAAVLPQRRANGLGCTPPEFAENEFQNWQASAPFTKDPVMGSPVFCVSNAEDNCELSQGIAHTEGIENSVEVSVNAGFTIAEVFELGVSVAYAHAWSSSDETSFGDTQLCPAGGMECGVVAYPKVVTVSGKVRRKTDRGCGDGLAWQDFAFTAPSIENVSGSNGKGVRPLEHSLQERDPLMRCVEHYLQDLRAILWNSGVP